MKNILQAILPFFLLFSLQNAALAASINYLITTGSVIEQRNGVAATGGEFMFSSAETLSAVFDYSDSAVSSMEHPGGIGTQYQNVSAFTMGTSSGSFFHTDDSAWTLVSNDRWTSGATEPVDALGINTNISPPFLGPPAEYPYYTDLNGITFKLRDMRVFWGEHFSGTDFLSDEDLPPALPVAGSGNGALALAFARYDTDGVTILDEHVVIGVFAPKDVSVIPIPAALWMFGSALAGLVIRRRLINQA